MIGPRPHPPARLLLAAVVLVLPAASRDRYREEFRSELAELPLWSQLFQAGTLLVGSLPLRKALRQVDVIEDLTSARDWRCRLGRHHYCRPRMTTLRCAGVTTCGAAGAASPRTRTNTVPCREPHLASRPSDAAATAPLV